LVELLAQAGRIGRKIISLDAVSSTLDEAKRLVGADEGTVVVAKVQRAGRGRLGRTWYSPRGGLWFTIILYPGQSATSTPLLNLMSAAAVAKGISNTTGLPASIRWPNDIYVHGGKVGGILTEMDVVDDMITRVLIGVGVNINFPVEELPEEVRGEATTLMREAGMQVDEDKLRDNILSEFERLYEAYRAGWRSDILKEAKDIMELLGAPVIVSLHAGTLIGVLEDVDELGRILLRIDQDSVHISPGDIERIRPV